VQRVTEETSPTSEQDVEMIVSAILDGIRERPESI
jgi:hypothetical protein